MLNSIKLENREVPYIDRFDKGDFIDRQRASWRTKHVISIALSYVAPLGAETWRKYTKFGPLEQASQEAFDALSSHARWEDFLAAAKVKLVVDFGPGTGTKTNAWLNHVSTAALLPVLLLVDISKPMLRLASSAINRAWPDIEMGTLRIEFEKLSQCRALLPQTAPFGRALFLMLGQSIGNVGLKSTVKIMRQNALAGDIVVVELDLARTRDGDRNNPVATCELYDNEEIREMCERAVSMVPCGGEILRPRPQFNEDGSFAVLRHHWDGKCEREVFRSTRYREGNVIWQFREAGFDLLISARARERWTYKNLVFVKR